MNSTQVGPRVWPANSPEPRDVHTVRSALVTWTRGGDGLWRSSRSGVAYSWRMLTAVFRLTEVFEPYEEWP